MRRQAMEAAQKMQFQEQEVKSNTRFKQRGEASTLHLIILTAYSLFYVYYGWQRDSFL